MKLFSKYLLSCLTLFIMNNVNAQIEDTTEYRNVRISTGNITPRTPGESVHNIKIIDQRTIQRMGAISLNDVLNKQLNIRLSNDNLLGSSMSLQGISGQNIKILLDGIPLTGRENGNIDLSQINLTNIERIEIIEGPMSVIYGTDALGGVINLVSKNIMLPKSTPVIGFGHAYYESIKQYNIGGGVVFKVKDVDFGASLNRNFFGGYTLDKDSRVMFWKPKQQVFGNFNIVTQTNRMKVRFKTDIFSEKIENRGTPIINHLEAYANDEYYLTNRNINSLFLEYKLNPKEFFNVLSSFSFYQRDKVTYRKDLTKTSNNMDVVPSQEANSTNSFLNFMSRGSYNNEKMSQFIFQFGYDVNLNSAFGTKIEADKGKMNDYAVYGCFEYKPFKNLDIKPGFRASYNTRYSAPFIPSIQMKYQLDRFSLRYAYGRGFRAPSLKELYLYFVDFNHNIIGNPDLLAELSDNQNAAIKYESKDSGDLKLTITNSYFSNQIYNQIALVAVNPLALEYTYGNVDVFKSIGTNVFIDLLYRKWKVVAGAAYMGVYNNAFEKVGKSKYLYSPEFNGQLSYKIKTKKLGTSVVSGFYKYNGKLYGYALNETRNIVSTYTEAFSILDFTLSHSLPNNKINFTFGCKNLLNVQNIISRGVSSSFHSSAGNTNPVSIGRSFFTQINFKI